MDAWANQRSRPLTDECSAVRIQEAGKPSPKTLNPNLKFAFDSKKRRLSHVWASLERLFSVALIANGGKIRQVSATGGKCL